MCPGSAAHHKRDGERWLHKRCSQRGCDRSITPAAFMTVSRSCGIISSEQALQIANHTWLYSIVVSGLVEEGQKTVTIPFFKPL